MEQELELLVVNECKDKGLDATFEALQNKVAEYAEFYSNVEFSDEQMKDAKKLKAKLNATREVLEKQRKLVKQAYLAPLESFEARVKALTALIDKPILQIDNQIKTYEQKVKEGKRAELHAYFDTILQDNVLKGLIKITNIWDDRYLNLTYDTKQAKQDIDNKLTIIKTGLDTIDSAINSEFKTEIKTLFIDTGNLAEALKRGQYLKERQEQMEQARRIQEEGERRLKEYKEKERQEQQQTNGQEVKAAVVAIQPQQEQTHDNIANNGSGSHQEQQPSSLVNPSSYIITITITDNQKEIGRQLLYWLRNNGLGNQYEVKKVGI